MRISYTALTLILCAIGARAQAPHDNDAARELFYSAMVKKDAPPPIHRAAARKGSSTAPKEAPPVAAAANLGLRYNLVLVDANSAKSQDVASDRIFRAGECFALNFASNRAGYLYVLAKESSGSWHPLMPSPDPDMKDETNVITPTGKVRVPLKHCFEIQNPPGTETLFVVLTREPRDFSELYEGIKNGAPDEQPAPAAPRNPAPVQVASVSDATVARIREQFGTRDIAIKRVSQPLAADEPAGSVYVVNASVKPAANIAAQIEVRHR